MPCHSAPVRLIPRGKHPQRGWSRALHYACDWRSRLRSPHLIHGRAPRSVPAHWGGRQRKSRPTQRRGLRGRSSSAHPPFRGGGRRRRLQKEVKNLLQGHLGRSNPTSPQLIFHCGKAAMSAGRCGQVWLFPTRGGKNSRNSLSYWFGEGYFASIFTTKIT